MKLLEQLKETSPEEHKALCEKLSEYKKQGINTTLLLDRLIAICFADDIQKIIIGRNKKSRKSNLVRIDEVFHQVKSTCQMISNPTLELPIGGPIFLNEIEAEEYQNALKFVRDTYLRTLSRYRWEIRLRKGLHFKGQKRIGRNEAVYAAVEQLKVKYPDDQAFKELVELCNLLVGDRHPDPNALRKFYHEHRNRAKKDNNSKRSATQ